MLNTLKRPVKVNDPAEIPDLFHGELASLPVEQKLALLFLTPERFRRWLKAQSPHAIAGYVGRPDACPIRNWLIDEGFRNVEVGVRKATVRNGTFWQRVLNRDTVHRYRMPGWAATFIDYVDGIDARVVTAGRALRELDKPDPWANFNARYVTRG